MGANYIDGHHILNLGRIYTHEAEFFCLGVSAIEVYKELKTDHRDTFIIEFNYHGERIIMMCHEPLWTIRVDDKGVLLTDHKNRSIYRRQHFSMDLFRDLQRLFVNQLPGISGMCQSIFMLISYEAGKLFEKRLCSMKVNPDVPYFLGVIPSVALLFKPSNDVKIVVNTEDETLEAHEFSDMVEKYKHVIRNHAIKHHESSNKAFLYMVPEYNYSESEFCWIVEKAKQYITAGDIFQVVLSVECSVKTDYTPVDIYQNISENNKNTTNYLVETNQFSILGASPEILVSNINGICTIKPLAGTLPHQGPRDIVKEAELINSEKDCAEHRMLVDLARNDLGRVCRFGSIVPKRLMNVEYYSHVMHISSEISGILNNENDSFDLFTASFPAGTMVGAPKIRAMEIINELENIPRGFYSGGIAIFTVGGDLYSFINIRSMTVVNNIAYLRAGAGIVYDSDPKKEYHECLNKLKCALTALPQRWRIQEESDICW